jgi:orotate phosphoribosyltransferase
MRTGVRRQERELQGILRGLYNENMVMTWYRDRPEGFWMIGGLWSPFYFNLRDISSADPALFKRATKAIARKFEELDFVADGRTRVVGIAMTGIPFSNGLLWETGMPSLYTRKLPTEISTVEQLDRYIEERWREHGVHALVEGVIKPGDRLIIVDDVITEGHSKFLAKRQIELELERRGLTNVTAEDLVVLINRGQGASARAKDLGFRLHEVMNFAERGLDWLKKDFSPVEHEVIRDYLRDPQRYMDEKLRQEVIGLARRR